jgi:hypothetical protein
MVVCTGVRWWLEICQRASKAAEVDRLDAGCFPNDRWTQREVAPRGAATWEVGSLCCRVSTSRYQPGQRRGVALNSPNKVRGAIASALLFVVVLLSLLALGQHNYPRCNSGAVEALFTPCALVSPV